MIARLISVLTLLALWQAGSGMAGPRMLPAPASVAAALMAEAAMGDLFVNLGATLARVGVAFAIAMVLGSALGVLMGRSHLADRLADPWLVALLNLPALVIIVLAYIWGGLTETAAIAAVALSTCASASTMCMTPIASSSVQFLLYF